MFIVPQCGVDRDHSYNCVGSSGPVMKHSVSTHFVCIFRVLGRELRDKRYKLYFSGIKDFESSPCSLEPHRAARGTDSHEGDRPQPCPVGE